MFFLKKRINFVLEKGNDEELEFEFFSNDLESITYNVVGNKEYTIKYDFNGETSEYKFMTLPIKPNASIVTNNISYNNIEDNIFKSLDNIMSKYSVLGIAIYLISSDSIFTSFSFLSVKHEHPQPVSTAS